MSDILCNYTGYLTFTILPERVAQLEAAAKELLGAIEIELTPNVLEFDYSGRDAGRKVVRFLLRTAPLIGDAEGNVVCRLSDDAGDGAYEYYTMRQGRLYRQRAIIVQQREELVRDEDEASSVPPTLALQ